jgi:hypothetical protein
MKKEIGYDGTMFANNSDMKARQQILSPKHSHDLNDKRFFMTVGGFIFPPFHPPPPLRGNLKGLD